jgi:hypothetical protein
LVYNVISQPFVQAHISAVCRHSSHHFTVDDYNGSDPAAWWTVIEFDANGGAFSTNIDAIPDWLIQKIKDDMKSLPAKE